MIYVNNFIGFFVSKAIKNNYKKTIAIFTCIILSKFIVDLLFYVFKLDNTPDKFNIEKATISSFFVFLGFYAFLLIRQNQYRNKTQVRISIYTSIIFSVSNFISYIFSLPIAQEINTHIYNYYSLFHTALLLIFTLPIGLWLLWAFHYANALRVNISNHSHSGLYGATTTTLFLVAVIVLSDAWLNWTYSTRQQYYTELINIAGRQRTHVQRIGWLSSLTNTHKTENAEKETLKIKNTLFNFKFEAHLLSDLLQKRHKGWEKGGDVFNMLQDAHEKRNHVLETAHALLSLQSGSSLRVRVQQNLNTAIDQFQAAIDRVITFLEFKAQDNLARSVQHTQNSLYILPSSLGFIFLTIILPIILIIKKQHKVLSDARYSALSSLRELSTYKEAIEKYFILFMTDTNGNIIYANSLFNEFSKFTNKEVINKSVDIIKSKEHSEKFFNQMKNCIAQGKTWNGEICHKAKDGTLYWVDSLIFPMFDSYGKVEKHVYIQSDITNRKKIEIALEQANATLKAFVKHAPAAVAMFDKSMRYILHTDRWRTDYNVKEHSLLGQYHYDIFPKTPQTRRGYHKRCLQGEVIQREEEAIALLDGSEKPHRWEARPWFKNDGSIGGILVLTENISQRKLAEEALRASEEKFRSLFLLVPVGVALIDMKTGKFVLVSEAMTSITGYSAEAFLEFGPYRLTAPEYRHLNAEHVEQLRTNGRFGPTEKEYIRADGTRVPVLVNGVALRDKDGRELCLKVVQDITSRRAIEERLWRLANLDILTGLPNRMLFNERLTAQAALAKEKGTLFAVGIVDVDSFKEINDSFGHDGGDELLRVVAKRLSQCLKNKDTVARLGGDEFAFLIQENNITELRDRVSQLLKSISAPVKIHNALRRTTISVGITVSPLHGHNPSELLKNADLALYRAKAQGKNRMEVFEPEMRSAMECNHAARQKFEEALRTNQLCLVYQPVVSLTDYTVSGFEALLRMRTSSGEVGPDTFGQIFQDPALAAPVGERVFQMAFAEMQNWQQKGLSFGQVSINVTSADFRTGRFPENLAAQLRRHKIDPSRICIEVTEGMFLGRGAETVCSALKRLKDFGVAIALDDFGTGFASLADLKKFPIDRLKIDKSFVTDMLVDESDASIVRAVIQLGHSLGMKVVAEGAENEEQLKALSDLGCDQVQGFIISKPIAAEHVPDYLENRLRDVA